MKLLMFHAISYWYKTATKNSEIAEDTSKEEQFTNVSIAFIHVEKEDEEKRAAVVRKAVKNITWHTRKSRAKKIVLHSFAHLSESKATPDFSREIIEEIRNKIETKGYNVTTTPFGYFLEFKLHVGGDSIERVFKAL